VPSFLKDLDQYTCIREPTVDARVLTGLKRCVILVLQSLDSVEFCV
jgi:hypothetical protein